MRLSKRASFRSRDSGSATILRRQSTSLIKSSRLRWPGWCRNAANCDTDRDKIHFAKVYADRLELTEQWPEQRTRRTFSSLSGMLFIVTVKILLRIIFLYWNNYKSFLIPPRVKLLCSNNLKKSLPHISFWHTFRKYAPLYIHFVILLFTFVLRFTLGSASVINLIAKINTGV